MKNRKILALMLAMVFILGTLITGCAKSNQPPAQDSGNTTSGDNHQNNDDDYGTVSLDFSKIEAVDQNGNAFTYKDFADKDVTVINLWGTFCTPCIQEMPDLDAFAKKLPDNVQLVALCVDSLGAPEDAKKILAKAGFEGIALLDGNDAFQAICNEMLSLPTTVFVDKDGHMIGNGQPMDDIWDSGTESGNANAGIILGGGMDNLDEIYLKAVNRALNAIGKEEIRLAD